MGFLLRRRPFLFYFSSSSSFFSFLFIASKDAVAFLASWVSVSPSVRCTLYIDVYFCVSFRERICISEPCLQV